MRQYHAHIYYEVKDLAQIKDLQEKARLSPLTPWRLFEKQVGPHALPMLELHFSGEQEPDAVTWLKENRGHFSVLIHEDTGDDVKDHEEARWLGEPLPINYHFFEQVKNNPNIAVHKK